MEKLFKSLNLRNDPTFKQVNSNEYIIEIAHGLPKVKFE